MGGVIDKQLAMVLSCHAITDRVIENKVKDSNEYKKQAPADIPNYYPKAILPIPATILFIPSASILL